MRIPVWRGRDLGVLMLLMLLGGLVACGSGTSGEATDGARPTVTTPNGSASGSTEAVGPVERDTRHEAGADGYTKRQLLRAMKAAMKDTRSAHFTMAMSANGQNVSAEGDLVYTRRGPELRMTMSSAALGPQEMDMRLVDGVVYFAMPPMTPKGKFLALDTNDPSSPYGAMGGLRQMDPLSTFDAFDAGLRKVRYVGEETVSGETMDHYVLTVDTAAASRAQGQPVAAGLPERLVYDLWLDEEDLMRKVSFDVNGMVAMDMTMSDWGKPVTVKAPPAGKVIENPQR